MVKLLILSILACAIFLATSDQVIPPALWCDDPSLAEKAGVSSQCQAYNSSAYNKRIKVTILYESMCGGCAGLIQDTIYPSLWRQGKDFIDLEFVPYGNAHHTPGPNGTYNITCQHDVDECKLNKLHSCAIDQLGETSRWLPFIFCLETGMSQGEDPDMAIQDCYTELRVTLDEQNSISDCTKGPRGDQLQKAAADRTDGVLPDKHTFVPWILINDISLASAQGNANTDGLLWALCSWYRGDKIPLECGFLGKSQKQKKCTRK